MLDLRLPDELWIQIMESGIRNSKLRCKDLCSISISCKLLHRLSDDDSLWSRLLSSHFPQPPLLQNPNAAANHHRSTSSSAKSTYKIRFERQKEMIEDFRKEIDIMKEKVDSIESRVHSLEMEFRLLRKQQMLGLSKAAYDRNEKQQALKKSREELESMIRLPTSGDEECNKKRKKLKRHGRRACGPADDAVSPL